ncbi:MAG TPA: hypothetical protein VNR38_25685 [Ureibacillus sp.]|nr:hypothetical protein [Ureibacillus sp.]
MDIWLQFFSLIGSAAFIIYKSLKKVWKRVNLDIDIRFRYKKK